MGRRRVLRGAGVLMGGISAAALVGCRSGARTTPKATSTEVGSGAFGTATATATAAVNAKRGGRLQTYSLTTAPNLDPVQSLSYQTHNRISLVYSNLVEMSRGPRGIYDTSIGPDLAQSWETAADGLTWTFKLRPNVKWANVAPMNGRVLTAEDVVWSFKRNLDPAAPNVNKYAMFDGPPVAVDATTVRFKLQYPHPGFLFNIAAEPSEITAKEVADKEGDFKNWGAGSGPFVITKYDAQTITSYRKNPDYYDAEHVYLDGVDIAVIPDKSTAMANFRAGQLDVIGGSLAHPLLPADADALMKSVPKAVRTDFLGSPNPVLEINAKSQPFQDIRVRQAASMAIDRQAHITALAGGAGAPTGTFPYGKFPEYALSAEELAKTLPFNVAEAKKLMAAAGFPNGFTAKIMWRTDAGQPPLNVHIEMLKAIGITLDTKSEAVDYPAWVSKTYNGQFTDMAEWGYGVGSIWDYVVGLHYSKGNRNGPQSKVPEVDAMIDKLLRTTKPEDQITQVKDIERYVLTKTLYIIPTITAQNTMILQPHLRDYVPGFGAMGGVYLSNYIRRAWLDK